MATCDFCKKESNWTDDKKAPGEIVYIGIEEPYLCFDCIAKLPERLIVKSAWIQAEIDKRRESKNAIS